jgi:multidrug efflux pump subunit AcrA (membrane-fusion protein)
VSIAATACTSGAHEVPSPEQSPLVLDLVRVAAVDLPQPFEAGGVVRAGNTATIASRVLAPVIAVQVRPGDRVRRGAVLVTLDARESVANATRADATLRAASDATATADADVRGAAAHLTLARTTHARIRTLFDKRSATAQELDQATATLAAAEAQLDAARTRAASAVAAREAAVAARDAVAVALSYFQLTAPFDGVVLERMADPGMMAAPGVPIITVEDGTGADVHVHVDEARAKTVRVGQTVDYALDNAAGQSWRPAEVTEIGRVDPATHGFLVKVRMPADEDVRSGSFGRVRFPGPARPALVVPAAAVVRRGQLSIVFFVDGDGRARLRPVSTGRYDNERVEITAGVSPDDTVVAHPPAGLADGTRVVPR